MKTLTDIAVRLRVITTSLLSILGFISLGLVIGFWLGSHRAKVMSAPTASGPAKWEPVKDPQQWCNATHKTPFIDALHCGGMTTCDRSYMMFGGAPPEVQQGKETWETFCAKFGPPPPDWRPIFGD